MGKEINSNEMRPLITSSSSEAESVKFKKNPLARVFRRVVSASVIRSTGQFFVRATERAFSRKDSTELIPLLENVHLQESDADVQPAESTPVLALSAEEDITQKKFIDESEKMVADEGEQSKYFLKPVFVKAQPDDLIALQEVNNSDDGDAGSAEIQHEQPSPVSMLSDGEDIAEEACAEEVLPEQVMESFEEDATISSRCAEDRVLGRDMEQFEKMAGSDGLDPKNEAAGNVLFTLDENIIGRLPNSTTTESVEEVSYLEQFRENALNNLFSKAGTQKKTKNLLEMYTASTNAYAKFSIGDFAELFQVAYDKVEEDKSLSLIEKTRCKANLESDARGYMDLILKEKLDKESAFGAFYLGHKVAHDKRLVLEHRLSRSFVGASAQDGIKKLQEVMLHKKVLPYIKKFVAEKLGGVIAENGDTLASKMIEMRAKEAVDKILNAARENSSKNGPSVRGIVSTLELIALLPEFVRKIVAEQMPLAEVPVLTSAPEPAAVPAAIIVEETESDLERDRETEGDDDTISDTTSVSSSASLPSEDEAVVVTSVKALHPQQIFLPDNASDNSRITPVSFGRNKNTGAWRKKEGIWREVITEKSNAARQAQPKSGRGASPNSAFQEKSVELTLNRRLEARQTSRSALEAAKPIIASSREKEAAKMNEIKIERSKIRQMLTAQRQADTQPKSAGS